LVKLQQFYVWKIGSAHLRRKNYKIDLSISEARQSGEIVSLGDSQLLRSVRLLKGIDFKQEDLNALLEEKKKIKRKKSSPESCKRLGEIEGEIDGMLFVPEIISVGVDHIRHYESMGREGFWVNGRKYVRLMVSAGQARRNNALFVDESYEKELKRVLNNGRKDIDVVQSKFSAYFALASSASMKVSTPIIAVIPDCEIVRTERVDFIEESTDPNKDDQVIECDKEITFSLFDGQGLISPRMARQWSYEDLELDYIPSAFIARSNFIKGLFVTFDFNEFSDEIGKHIVKDMWGNDVNIRDVDIVLTASQFKLWSAFDSCQQYMKNCRENNLSWGVTRVAPKKENDVVNLNYQFCQILDLNDEQVSKLCQQTVDYFGEVVNGNVDETLVYLLGKLTEDYSEKMFDKIHDNVTKALILNRELIKDPYIKGHLIAGLNKKIKESYIGNLMVLGNYEFMIADPYAFCEHLFGMEVKGLLKRNEHYCQYWLDKGDEKVVAMRAPLTYKNEAQILNLKDGEERRNWYKYINSGVIYNVFGVDCMVHGGSD